MPHRVEQADGGQHRQAQRQHHLPQHHRRGGAVDQRRLLQALRDREEEIAHDQHPERVDELWNHQRPQGVVEAGVAHHQVGRNQAAVEQDGKEHEHRDRRAPRHAALGQGVGERRREQQVQRRAHHHPEQGYAVGADDRAALGENGVVGAEIEGLRNQHQAAASRRLRRAHHRRGRHYHERNDEPRRQQDHEHDVAAVEYPLAARDADRHYQSPSCSSFLAVKLAPTTMSSAMIDLNTSTAAA